MEEFKIDNNLQELQKEYQINNDEYYMDDEHYIDEELNDN